MKNNKLRVIWMIPNVFCYLMFFGYLGYVLIYAKELEEIDRLFSSIMMSLAVLFVSILGSFRIRSWIKEGKM